ncbi:amidohydrolase family protein [Methylomonas koyamae]|uniref:amidohydrolase family protein n=1 Tax=Methylomonas koyamae TaxID=702114 RepID=UPI00278BFB67|nr:amidohydrolase family protein [Methylomonas koyamae]
MPSSARSGTESGVAALETLLPLTLALTGQHRIGLAQALAGLTCNPARIMGLAAGTLAIGANADVCIFDPALVWRVERPAWLSAGCNTPYWGRELIGRVTHTLQAGRVAYRLQQPAATNRA